MDSKDQATRVKEFEKKLAVLEAQYQIKQSVGIEFPKYKILPDEVQLALKVIKNYGGIFIGMYKDTKEVKP